MFVNAVLVKHYGLMTQAQPGRGGPDRGQRRSSYHHGDLPNALADAATEMARQGGPDAVVLRAAARAAGVSAAAAYRHFADHGELLQVVRQRALSALADSMRKSLAEGEPLADPAQEALRKLRALGRAYIRFALEDPGLFRTAFSRPVKPPPPVSGRLTEHSPYALMSEVLDELVQAGVLEPSRREVVEIPAWGAVHGIATLLVDGPLALLTDAERAEVIARNYDFVLNGLSGTSAER